VDKQDLAERILRIEEENAIHGLVYRYASLCDDRYSPDALAALFLEDASWSAASSDGELDFGTHRGRDAIRNHFAGLPARIGVPTLHAVMAPEISLASDGTSATGRWYTIVLLTMLGASDGSTNVVMLGATYEHDYTKVNGEWLFSRVAAHFHFHLPVGTEVAAKIGKLGSAENIRK